MIERDQPGFLPKELIVAVSSKDDGTVLDRSIGAHHPSVLANRQRFCATAGFDYADAVFQKIVYAEDQTYDKIVAVGPGHTSKNLAEVPADALFTEHAGVGLFLPVADCVATVIFDSKKSRLCLAHLGRHSTYAMLAKKVIEYFERQGSDPSDLIIWMGPHAQKQSYVMQWFDKSHLPEWQGFFDKQSDGIHLDMAGFNRQQFISAGVLPQNITVSTVDTVTDEGYFSHQVGDTTSRIAVLAAMRPL